MAVEEIEDEVKNIAGVLSVSSAITPGKFSIVLELEKGIDKATAIRDTEDVLSLIKVNLPSDMDDPVIRGVAHSRSIMHVSILSSKVSRDKLKELSKKLKSDILSIKDISDVTIFGDSELFYEILIDEKKVNAYNISMGEVLRLFSEVSYIFPLGKIDNAKEPYYISTHSDKKFSNELENTVLNINNQQIMLKDIASISKKYEDSSTLASTDGKNSITLAISQNPKGNAITIAQDIYDAKEAAFLGTKEVAKPVIIASLTTIFSFIPLLMISGKLGEIVQLIPIAFSALVIASLLESFIFLPIHATHTLNSNSKTLSWEKANLIYQKVLTYLIGYKKSFLTLFVIIVPLLIVYSVEKSKFQMFQPFDNSSISITFKANPATTLEESLDIVQTLEKDILKFQDRFFVKFVNSTAGYRRSATGSTEIYPYVGYITLELYKMKPSNIFDKYITPYLSFYYDSKDRIRDLSSQEISKDLRVWLKEQNYKQRFHLNDLMVVENK